ncbi:MAG: metal-dependent hydrolase [Pseudomonadota bacterium]|nr:metal-dependent hydrolase [Pseudomonadota bacterium]
MTAHPMDLFPIRPLRFDAERLANADPVWSQSCPDFSRFINALGLHVPFFERFLISTLRTYRDDLRSGALRDDVRRIIGQEAHHAFNFEQWNAAMCARYPHLGEVEANAKEAFERAFARSDRRFRVGFTAGYETFTFLGGAIILDRYEELMGDADPSLRALWVWHQVEEVEHGAVAFDVYQALFAEHEWYRKAMVLRAFAHIARETLLAFHAIVRSENRPLISKLRSWRFFAGFARDLFCASLPVLRRGYHPRRHPICTSGQNRIATAWRLYTERGGDAHFLDEDAVHTMLAGTPST